MGAGQPRHGGGPFDKVTHVHGGIASQPGFTMVDEYAPHAIAAVRRLQSEPSVDPGLVFVIGHSGGGGRAAPRVAAAESSIAGIVMLAGDAAPLGLPPSEPPVTCRLCSLAPDAETHGRHDHPAGGNGGQPDLSPTTSTSDLLFGWSASYWLDLRGFDQVATAAALDKPMLILQGGRDYQVTAEDDLTCWRAGLARPSNVSFASTMPTITCFFRAQARPHRPTMTCPGTLTRP